MAAVAMPATHVLIRQQEPHLGRLQILVAVLFQGAELRGIDAHVGIKAGERRPVPAGPDRQYGVDRGRGFLVLLRRKQDQTAELVRHGVVGFPGDGLIDLRHGRFVIALGEGIASRVESLVGRVVGVRWDRGNRLSGRRRCDDNRLRIVDRRAFDDDHVRIVRIVVRPVAPAPRSVPHDGRGDQSASHETGRPPRDRSTMPRMIPMVMVVPVAVIPMAVAAVMIGHRADGMSAVAAIGTAGSVRCARRGAVPTAAAATMRLCRHELRRRMRPCRHA